MTLISFLATGAACLCFGFVFIMWRIDSTVVNRAFAITWAVSGAAALGAAFLSSAQDDASRWLFFRLSTTAFCYIKAFNLVVMLLFTKASPRSIVGLSLPVFLISTVEVAQLWSGEWLLTGFVSTAWGTAPLFVLAPFWYPLNIVTQVLVAAVITFFLLRAAWGSSTKRLGKAALLVWSSFAAVWILQSAFFLVSYWWRVPDLTVVLILVIGIMHAEVTFRHLYFGVEGRSIEQEIMGTVQEGILLVDEDFRILKGNPSAGRIWGCEPESLKGLDFTTLFRETAELRKEWSVAKEVGRKENLPCSSEGTSCLVSLSPVQGSTGFTIGGIVTIKKMDPLDEASKAYGLTSREQSVLLRLLQGYSNKETAAALFISAGTVKNHIFNIYKKTGAESRVDLFRLLLGEG